MRKITIKELQALTAADAGKAVRDEGGIVGRVRAGQRGVTVAFRYEFKLEGKKGDHSIGSWPKKSLQEIRLERDRVRAIVVKGLSPIQAKKAERFERQKALEATLAQAEAERKTKLTVRDLFNDWIADGVARKDQNKELIRLFNRDVLPQIGDTELRRLTDKDLLSLLRKMLARGVVRQTVVAFDDITQMLNWGEQRQPWRGLLVDGNPAKLVDIEKLLPDDYAEERDRVLSPEELRELDLIFRRTAEEYDAAPAGSKYQAIRPLKKETTLAIWICLGTLCRIGELLMGEWKHVDLDARTWFIPRANVKGRRKQKQDHIVFLSDFAHQQFVELHRLSGNSRWLFPSRPSFGEESHVCPKSVTKQIGDRQTSFKKRTKALSRRRNDDTLVLANGINGEWTPHDMRRTGATMMQQLHIPLDIIDRCQNHVLAGSKVRRHYLHYDYREEKTEAWQKLGTLIESILAFEKSTTTLISQERSNHGQEKDRPEYIQRNRQHTGQAGSHS